MSCPRPDRQNPKFLFIFLFPQHLCNLYSCGSFGWLGTVSVLSPIFIVMVFFFFFSPLFFLLLLLLLLDAVCIKSTSSP